MKEEERVNVDSEEDVQYLVYVDDWILADVLDDGFYNFEWWSDVAKSAEKPIVKRSSLAKELVIKAAEAAIASFYFGNEPIEQKKRIEFIVGKSVDDGIDEKYEKQKLSLDEVRYDGKEMNRLYGLARNRFMRSYDGLEKLDDGSDADYKERTTFRNQAFECAYLCLRTEDPESTFYILWGLIDSFCESIRRAAGE